MVDCVAKRPPGGHVLCSRYPAQPQPAQLDQGSRTTRALYGLLSAHTEGGYLAYLPFAAPNSHLPDLLPGYYHPPRVPCPVRLGDDRPSMQLGTGWESYTLAAELQFMEETPPPRAVGSSPLVFLLPQKCRSRISFRLSSSLAGPPISDVAIGDVVVLLSPSQPKQLGTQLSFPSVERLRLPPDQLLGASLDQQR